MAIHGLEWIGRDWKGSGLEGDGGGRFGDLWIGRDRTGLERIGADDVWFGNSRIGTERIGSGKDWRGRGGIGMVMLDREVMACG